MTVAEFIEQLQMLPPDNVVVVPASDHSYREVHTLDAAFADSYLGHLAEFYDDLGEEPRGKVIEVVVIA